jgi:acetyltransferase-like isoleucine patch superfamily enzyme
VIRIGHDVTILNKLKENLAGIVHPTVLVAASPGAELIIGNHVGISGAIIYCTEKIIIEDYAGLGANAKIYDTDFHPVAFEARKASGVANVAHAPVILGMGCWIGADAIVLKGTHVGARAVVAAGAVVTKDVPPDTIVAGVPARVVGKVPSVSPPTPQRA